MTRLSKSFPNGKSGFDVIVVGAGHAGAEAALATARLGHRTCLVTLTLDNIASMPCNPAIGGLAKGQIVRELDALGGQMAKAIDATGIQFRRLNRSKGPAVQSTRAQADKAAYSSLMRKIMEDEHCLTIHKAMVTDILTSCGQVRGIATSDGEEILCRVVILCPGTFMNGLLHTGLQSRPGGRRDEEPSVGLSESLSRLGFMVGRLKTGTVPRLDGRTINYDGLEPQYGDDPPPAFSFETEAINRPLVPCYLTYTNERAHDAIRSGLDRSPLFTGVIRGRGPRYCPSIEDKVVRFPDRDRHQIFLEPEGLDTYEVYPNGISTSLPYDIQEKMVRSIAGLEEAVITKPGYAVEYDFVPPTQLFPSLETKKIKNLYFAGQINGTSGYEEAAGQGLMAGINASLRLRGKEPFILRRQDAYIGVLIDDLVTKGTEEPYRMFTSRAEYRLLLREDNADLRLTEKGYQVGLISEERMKRFGDKQKAIFGGLQYLANVNLNPTEENAKKIREVSEQVLTKPINLLGLLKRPGVFYKDVVQFLPKDKRICDEEIISQIQIQAKYEGYIRRQMILAERQAKLEDLRIPESFNFNEIPGLSVEVKEKLSLARPYSLGQASRISGITPAALTVLMIYLKKKQSKPVGAHL